MPINMTNFFDAEIKNTFNKEDMDNLDVRVALSTILPTTLAKNIETNKIKIKSLYFIRKKGSFCCIFYIYTKYAKATS